MYFEIGTVRWRCDIFSKKNLTLLFSEISLKIEKKVTIDQGKNQAIHGRQKSDYRSAQTIEDRARANRMCEKCVRIYYLG